MYQVCVWTDWIAVVVMVCGRVLVVAVAVAVVAVAVAEPSRVVATEMRMTMVDYLVYAAPRGFDGAE